VKIDFSFITILYFAAIVQGFFSAGLLFSSTKNKVANRLLAFLMLAITGWLIDAFFRVANIYGQNPNLYFLPIYYSFSFGPLLYFYVQSITNSTFKFKGKYLVHFIPVSVQALFYWIVTFQSYQTKYSIWLNIHLPYTYRIEYDGSWISLSVYLLLSIRLIFKYQRWLNDNYTDVSQKMLNWLKICLFILILICVSWLFEAILRDAKGTYYRYDFSGDLLCIVIYLLGVFSYKQANIDMTFEPATVLLPPVISFTADDAIVVQIENAMINERLYLNAELTLADVAKHLKIPAKIVSANINAAFKKPFNSYVNQFRVEAIKKRLDSDDIHKLTLLGIAYESGFNSKTSFNRIFKEFTGVSPSQYIKK
jgi:AraC-like DNA-binding protein